VAAEVYNVGHGSTIRLRAHSRHGRRCIGRHGGRRAFAARRPVLALLLLALLSLLLLLR